MLWQFICFKIIVGSLPFSSQGSPLFFRVFLQIYSSVYFLNNLNCFIRVFDFATLCTKAGSSHHLFACRVATCVLVSGFLKLPFLFCSFFVLFCLHHFAPTTEPSWCFGSMLRFVWWVRSVCWCGLLVVVIRRWGCDWLAWLCSLLVLVGVFKVDQFEFGAAASGLEQLLWDLLWVWLLSVLLLVVCLSSSCLWDVGIASRLERIMSSRQRWTLFLGCETPLAFCQSSLLLKNE